MSSNSSFLGVALMWCVGDELAPFVTSALGLESLVAHFLDQPRADTLFLSGFVYFDMEVIRMRGLVVCS